MFNILFLIFFFSNAFKIGKLNTSARTILKMIYEKNNIGGYDGRYNETESFDFEKIKINNDKMNLLKYLENSNIALLDKLERLEEYEKNTKGASQMYSPNLTSANLFKDWLFEL